MGYIKVPEGIDFIIKSKPLTDKERKEISKFIQEYNAKKKVTKPRKSSSKEKDLA